jgi:sugar phosphate isomerase/epimerase
LLSQHGLPREALVRQHARLMIEPIARQLEQIDHPNIAMTLDFAHLWIAANDMEFDYLASIRAAAPWVKHLHFSDNFGRLDQGFSHEPDRWALGEADMHMPPGFGSIPLRGALAQLPDYRGDAILEIEAGFIDDAASGREHIIKMID